MKRIFELKNSEMAKIDKRQLVEIIRHSEGRTICAETVISCPPLSGGVSNPELAAAFGADLITLNDFSFAAPFVFGYDDDGVNSENLMEYVAYIQHKISINNCDADYIRKLRRIIGRFIGCNMEPVPDNVSYDEGKKLNRANLETARRWGVNYIVITANPNTGVRNEDILRGIELARRVLDDGAMIFAGKMHGAGGGNAYDAKIMRDYVNAGADCVLYPAPGTVPGVTLELACAMSEAIHTAGGLVMTAFGTSQESSNPSLIEQISIMNKMAGADIHHIGDAGLCGIAPPENIRQMSIAVRGVRHTLRRMATSGLR
ncbi:MAG: hypothetical protein WCV63_07015 [Negativicutes bacterium]|jgi:hypothetical protein